MKHINQLAQQLQVSPDIVRAVCQTLGLEFSGDTVAEQVEQQLLQLKAAAAGEGISLEEAARHLLEMRERQNSDLGNLHRFDKREYIRQRFGVDPEQAAGDSFVGILYQDVDKGVQLGELRHKVVLESSTFALEEKIFHGGSLAEGKESGTDGYTEAQERITSRINDDFFGKVNWGEEVHPALVGTSTLQPRQLKSSQPKTGQSQKK